MAGKKLNDLDGKEWVKSTKSWFVLNPRSRSKNQLTHPAKFPEELVVRFVEYFTQAGAWVIDPFAGVASTMVACKTSNRSSVGVELNPEFVDIGQKELKLTTGSGVHHILTGDSMDIAAILETQFGDEVPEFDYLITSPPYYNMLRKSRGGNETVHKERGEKGLKQHYSGSPSDLGNIESYQEYLEHVGLVLDAVYPYLRNGAYLTAVVQNMRDEGNLIRPIAWDLAKRFSEAYQLRQEQVWCQDNKRLGCWGFPSTYVSNVHHHYCLIFQKQVESND
ncbi:MAG: DNA methyltransferase [Candidatus Thorarchaeota archaeon]